jgi:hypothetical protein
VQRRLLAIQPVQVANQATDAGVGRGSAEGAMGSCLMMVPFPGLAELLPMNSSFLPGKVHWSAVEQTQVRETLPFVARHLVEQRALAMHDLVV